jgi:hypothetical protein
MVSSHWRPLGRFGHVNDHFDRHGSKLGGPRKSGLRSAFLWLILIVGLKIREVLDIMFIFIKVLFGDATSVKIVVGVGDTIHSVGWDGGVICGENLIGVL